MTGHLEGDEPAVAPDWLPVGRDPDPAGNQSVLDEMVEDAVDPAWGPPETGPPLLRRFHRAAPTVIIVLAVAFLFGASAWTFDPTPRLRDTFLPQDGANVPARLDDAPGQLEHAIGPSQLLTSQGLTGNVIANERSPEWFYDTHVYRATARTGEDSVDVVFDVTASRLSLDAITSPTMTFVPLAGIVLSDDATDGQQSWSHRGQAGVTGGDEVDVEGEIRRADEGACSTWTIDLDVAGTKSLEQIELQLCEGKGLSHLTYSSSRKMITLDTGRGSTPSGAYRGEIASAPRAESDVVADWDVERPVVSKTDGLGTGEVIVQGQVAPQMLRSDLIVLPNMYDQNLTAIELAPSRQQESTGSIRWHAHPGGTIVSMITMGDLTLVATSQRRLMAYDERGLRVWAADLGETATAMTRSGDHVAVSLSSGEVVAIDVRDGTEVWSFQLAAPGNGQIDATSSYVAVADVKGDIQVLDAGTGEKVWWSSSGIDAAAVGIAVSGRHLISLRTTRLEIFDVETGRFVWGDNLPGIGHSVLVEDEQIVYGSTEATRIADLQGNTVGTLPAVDQIRSLYGRVIMISGSHVQAVGEGGSTGPVWDLGSPLGSIYQCVCGMGPEGLVFSQDEGLVVIR